MRYGFSASFARHFKSILVLIAGGGGGGWRVCSTPPCRSLWSDPLSVLAKTEVRRGGGRRRPIATGPPRRGLQIGAMDKRAGLRAVEVAALKLCDGCSTSTDRGILPASLNFVSGNPGTGKVCIFHSIRLCVHAGSISRNVNL